MSPRVGVLDSANRLAPLLSRRVISPCLEAAIIETSPLTAALPGYRYTTSADVIIERLGDSLLAVQLGTDRILELNDTAARLLDLLLAGKTDVEAVTVISAEYDAPTEEVTASVAATVASLTAEKILVREAS